MKSLKILIAILLVATIASCSSDDDNNVQLTQINSWNLARVTGGFAGVDQTFPEGLIVWTFNGDTDTVVVVNNNTDNTLNDFFDSGTYPYTIENDGTNDVISIDGIDFGVISETENELLLDHQVDDGFTVTFTR